MNILITSDTHLEFPPFESLLNADIFIHAGDWTNLGYQHRKAEFALFEKFLQPKKTARAAAAWIGWGVDPESYLIET